MHVKTSRGVRRGSVQMQLECPSGTLSTLLSARSADYTQDGFDWTFMTVRCWDESPIGTWHFRIFYSGVCLFLLLLIVTSH